MFIFTLPSALSLSLRLSLFLLSLYLPLAKCGWNHKRGLAFADGAHPEDIRLAGNSAPSWMYNWSPNPPSISAEGIKHIPMQWGSGGVEHFAEIVRAHGAETVLGFNEPDLASQSNIDPRTAAALWKQHINPLAASGIKLGSPAVTSAPAPAGHQWLTEFLNACTGCTVDFIALHWYGEGAENFIGYVRWMHELFPGRTIWVTEFAETRADRAVQSAFISATTTFLDSASYVGGYAHFDYSRDTNSLGSNLLTNGGLNDLGWKYVHS